VSLVFELKQVLAEALSVEASALAQKYGRARAEDYATHCEQVGRIKGIEQAQRVVLAALEQFEVDDDE
jgi:hypothetical protein